MRKHWEQVRGRSRLGDGDWKTQKWALGLRSHVVSRLRICRSSLCGCRVTFKNSDLGFVEKRKCWSEEMSIRIQSIIFEWSLLEKKKQTKNQNKPKQTNKKKNRGEKQLRGTESNYPNFYYFELFLRSYFLSKFLLHFLFVFYPFSFLLISNTFSLSF